MTMLVLLKYLAFLPVLVLALTFFSSKHFPLKKRLFSFDTDFNDKTTIKILWLIIGVYIFVFGSMSCLRYLAIQSTILDLGVYENRIWQISHNFRFEYLVNGHFSPILLIHAIFYKIIPSSLTLLVLQTITISSAAIPLFYLSIKCLSNNKLSLFVVVTFFLLPAVEYNNLFDFHPDHVFIALIIFCFYFLETENKVWFLIAAILSMLVKEPYLFGVAVLGVYVIARKKWYKIGFSVSALSIIIFFIHAKIILPHYYEGVNPLIQSNQSPYAYLGNSLSGIIKTILTNPLIVINELVNLKKLQFVYVLLAPLIFIPFFGIWSLILIVPSLAIQLLSTSPLHYSINNQYTASMTPFIFVSFIYGIQRLMLWGNKEINSGLHNTYWKSGKTRIIEVIIVGALSTSIYFNIIIGISPVSYLFWNYKNEANPYSVKNYIITKRDKTLNEVINMIPDKASVCAQNSVYTSRLSRRNEFWVFPWEYKNADFIVLDKKRMQYVYDHVDEEKYDEIFNRIPETHATVFQEDGIYLFRKEIW